MKKIYVILTVIVTMLCCCGCNVGDTHFHIFTDGMCDCGVFSTLWLNTNFDISEETIICDATVEDDFDCDVILLTLKHTTTYIELTKRHFQIECVTNVVYIMGPTPPKHFYEAENKDKLEAYHQIVFLYVEGQDKSQILQIIKELEKLPFVHSASPNYIVSGDV